MLGMCHSQYLSLHPSLSKEETVSQPTGKAVALCRVVSSSIIWTLAGNESRVNACLMRKDTRLWLEELSFLLLSISTFPLIGSHFCFQLLEMVLDQCWVI